MPSWSFAPRSYVTFFKTDNPEAQMLQCKTMLNALMGVIAL
jgi:hypothetical protein